MNQKSLPCKNELSTSPAFTKVSVLFLWLLFFSSLAMSPDHFENLLGEMEFPLSKYTCTQTSDHNSGAHVRRPSHGPRRPTFTQVTPLASQWLLSSSLPRLGPRMPCLRTVPSVWRSLASGQRRSHCASPYLTSQQTNAEMLRQN